ncbi:Nif3-like dinuclear metal center hexameric protein [Marinobacter lutaoensis]|jgi:dinuclear metal center YbgI/SA1388 family protein|uniref:GTP cyclohydrolase 1 type 2 homolog n=1 Tax=Marinobacter lutaoensis TaxID=135739 RepID=A0A1V2DW59_9GAMM|nr:Nif3-like dinuclear metal center hexameric protein [Marinobacter lutaoensis]MBI43244.1 Nif3-like dinuclear metal center hexameric protein [Oceanospirillales bacterium]NVD34975.1 Nif3-like dinuclear metal center hexameric protein [Marinobacter lutaoensis]ONF45004.1 Nif3-like dinuclear metal center hexameric protein [Marinobacter lutaoensis]|tara:strand:- start:1732 stop:2475 length:744 start_codon:yes stop_codon:yes gene_type:complete
MVHRAELLARLDDWLQPRNFQDYCPNGLQVEGRETVGTLVTGVTASLALIEAAIAANADMILVHHGYFWKGEDPCVRGMKKARLKRLLEHDLNLVAYHLPLDDHPDYGNNRQLAEVLGLRNARPLDGLVWQGELPEPMTPGALADHLASRLHRQPLHVGEGPAEIRHVGWCTGAAQGFIDRALAAGLDAYISGEISEPTTHTAREAGIHYYAAGHHATERYGVQALGEALAREFGLTHLFIDCDNPV